MEKDLQIIELFEIYKSLLTEKQRDIFSSYYYLDLSLAEIAEPEGNTRQSVYETVKKVKAKLIGFEKELKVLEKEQKLLSVANRIEDKGLKQEIKEIIGR